MLFLFFALIKSAVVITDTLPDDTGFVDPVERTPVPTVAASTPRVTDRRADSFKEVTVTAGPNKVQTNLLYAFIALVCIALVGIIASITYFIIKKKNSGQVAASPNDQEDDEAQTQRSTTMRTTTTQNFNATRSMRMTSTSRPQTGNSTVHAKSIYAVNTVIL